MALLDILLKSTIDGKPLTDDDIQEEVDTFMFEVYKNSTIYMEMIKIKFYYLRDMIQPHLLCVLHCIYCLDIKKFKIKCLTN